MVTTMPAKKIGSCVRYDYLTRAEEAVFWHEQRNDVGVAISARDHQAALDGKQVTVKPRTQRSKPNLEPEGKPKRRERLPHNPS